MRFLLLAWALAGCATAYPPRPGPRLSEVIEDGKVMLARGGERFPADASGLYQAVQGNPAARWHAGTFGMWKSFGYASLLTGSLFTAGAQWAENEGQIPLRNGLIGVGLAAAVGGIILFAVAHPHYYDAINLYNDGLEFPRAGQGQTGARFQPVRKSHPSGSASSSNRSAVISETEAKGSEPITP